MQSDQVWQAAVAFGLALGAGLLLVPLAIALGRRFGFATEPRLFDKRSVKVSYLGGSAVALATVAAFGVVSGVPFGTGALLACSAFLILLGLADDHLGKFQSPSFRLVLQFGVAIAGWLAGLRSDSGGILGAVGSVLFLVAAMNAFNLLDNMDGVAGMTAAGTAAGITGIALLGDQFLVATLGAAVCGACLGFLRFNFHKARVYLGNGGSLFLGFMLGAAALKLRPPVEPAWALLALVVILAVPITDTSVVILSRLLHRLPLMSGGTDHVSHRLVRLGWQKRHVASIHGLAALAAAGMVAVSIFSSVPHWMVGTVAAFALAGAVLLRVDAYGPGPLKHRVRTGLVVGGLVVGGSIALAMPAALAGRDNLEASRSFLSDAAEAARKLDFSAADVHLRSAEEYAQQARDDLESPLVLPASLVPFARGNIQASRDLANGMSLLIPSFREAFSVAEKTASGGSVSFTRGRLALEPLPEVVGGLKRAAEGVDLAETTVRGSDKLLLPTLAGARNLFLSQAAEFRRSLEKGLRVAEVLPEIMGADGPRTYFLMIQNPSEQRATGGFIGAFGIIKAENGLLRVERMESNLGLPNTGGSVLSPSSDFTERYGRFDANNTWQNVNMTPDFPTAAKLVTQLWHSRTGQRLDGVLSVDAQGLASLMKSSGPVSVPDWPQPITSENFVSIAVNEAYVAFPEKPGRVDFLLSAGRAIFDGLFNAEAPDSKNLVAGLTKSFSEKHMQLWTEKESSRLKALGADGSLKGKASSDYLLVVGQNAAANKVDFYGHRRIDYRADVNDAGAVKARARISIENRIPSTGLPQYITGPYGELLDSPGLSRSYLSLYVPKATGASGAKLQGKNVDVESHSEKGFGVISKFVEVPAGKSSSLDLGLSGHKVGSPGEYRLVVQHQPGVNPDSLSISVGLPEGAVVKQMTPGMSWIGGRAVWSGALTSDKEFLVKFSISLPDRFIQRVQNFL